MREWLVVVSRSSARVFDQNMQLLRSFDNPLGRTKNRELTTGKPGTARNRRGARSSTHRLTGEKNPHDDAARVFAKKIGDYLTKQDGLRSFSQLRLAAEPRMLGWLRKRLTPRMASRLEWIAKDLGGLTEHEIKRLTKRGLEK